MNVRLKSFSSPVLVALLLTIGTVGGCIGSREVCWSEYVTVYGHYIATRRIDPNDEMSRRVSGSLNPRRR